jgi:ElaB/YqjD/DUF883 family membrane-anchored ribosome-binding protein
MFGSTPLERRTRPTRIADQSWEQFASAVNSAAETMRDTARSAKRGTSHLAEETGDRVGATADEAWKRAALAVDALAGRRRGLPWPQIVGAAVLGAAIGWAAGSAARAVTNHNLGSRRSDRVEFVDVDQPDVPVSRDA